MVRVLVSLSDVKSNAHTGIMDFLATMRRHGGRADKDGLFTTRALDAKDAKFLTYYLTRKCNKFDVVDA
jgi:hypothetical protein